MTEQEKMLEKLSRDLVDRGKLIESGWIAMRAVVFKGNEARVSARQIVDMRNCFFAGAQHLFASLMTILDGGAEATEKDMDRISLINKELNGFIDELRRAHPPAPPP